LDVPPVPEEVAPEPVDEDPDVEEPVPVAVELEPDACVEVPPTVVCVVSPFVELALWVPDPRSDPPASLTTVWEPAFNAPSVRREPQPAASRPTRHTANTAVVVRLLG
jgi:hypothetical protein